MKITKSVSYCCPSPMGRRWHEVTDEGFLASQLFAKLNSMTERKKTAFAKHLRRNQTSAETLVWAKLRGRRCGGYKFRRQAPIGKYIVDFLCVSQKLIVEIDGPTHEETQDYDTHRTRILESQGYQLIRLTNDDIYEDLDASIDAIWNNLENARSWN